MKKDKDWLKRTVTEKADEMTFTELNKILNIIDQLDEPRLPAVPKFVADWIKNNWWINSYGTLERLMALYDSCQLQTDVYEYYISNKGKVIRAILDDYVIEEEKEKFYCIKLPTKSDSLYVNYDVNERVHFDIFKATQFTEQEIKAIDERYWAFAEEVI